MLLVIDTGWLGSEEGATTRRPLVDDVGGPYIPGIFLEIIGDAVVGRAVVSGVWLSVLCC